MKKNNIIVGLSKFFLDNDRKKCGFEDYTDEKLLEFVKEVRKNLPKAKPGYRKGVILVPISPQGFECPLVVLKDGMTLVGQFKKRLDIEEPRKKTWVPNVKGTPAKFVDVVLYHRDVLAETKENSCSTNTDWEIITVLPKLDRDQPMPPETLCYNHFQLSGGTSTKMSDKEFIKALKESFVYWKDKSMIG